MFRSRPDGRAAPTWTSAVLLGVTLASILSPAAAVAQTPTPSEAPLQGFVVDELTGEVIPSARVTILGTDLETRTGPAGTFAFPSPPPGDVSVRVEASGYPTIVDNVEVKPDQVVFMHVVLPQVQLVLGEVFVIGRRTPNRGSPDRGARTAADLLVRQVPGAFQPEGNLGKNDGAITLRGVGTINLSSDPIVMLDGVRLGGDLSDALDALRRIPAAQVRQVSVLRGPAAAFIQGAANGAVVVETRSGYDEDR